MCLGIDMRIVPSNICIKFYWKMLNDLLGYDVRIKFCGDTGDSHAPVNPFSHTDAF